MISGEVRGIAIPRSVSAYLAFSRFMLFVVRARRGESSYLVPGIAAEAARLKEVFRGNYVRHPEAVEDTMGLQLCALILQLDAACRAAGQLVVAVEEAFLQHPDAQKPLSFPGLGPAGCKDSGQDRR